MLNLDPIQKLTKDLKEASYKLSNREARYLVDAYYTMQDNRIRADGQVRSMKDTGEPSAVIQWLAGQNEALENQIKKALDYYSAGHPAGRWMRRQKGIGPVISAGFLAHLDITKCPTAGHVWSYAGYDPRNKWIGSEEAKKTAKEVEDQHGKLSPIELNAAMCIKLERRTETLWERIERHAQVRADREAAKEEGAAKEAKITKDDVIAIHAQPPHNADFKVLCWKAGQSFVKVSGNEDAFYGRIYAERKIYEIERNDRGGNADAAAKALREKNYGKETEAYKAYSVGKLPKAQIQARAERYAVKLFLSHLHEIWRKAEGLPLPAEYAQAILGHGHYIAPPLATEAE